MSTNRQMPNELLRDFINMYRSLPCLWQVKSPDYTNRQMKARAYGKLVELVKPVIPYADKEFVIKKINTIRACFRKELKKVMESRRRAYSPDDVYIPTLWYFHLLSFTTNLEIIQSGNEVLEESNETQENTFDPQGFNLPEDQPIKQDDPSLHSMPASVISQPPSNAKKRKLPKVQATKRKRKTHGNGLTTKILSRALNTLCTKEDEFSAIGLAIGQKLRKISKKSETQRIFCERILNEAMFQAELGKLNEMSHITSAFTPNNVTDQRYCSKKFLIEFIELYRSLPCLWNMKLKSYTDRNQKAEAYNILQNKLLEVDENATKDTVIKRIGSLRASFRKEHKKVVASKKSRSGEEETYTPRLWYYNMLLFLHNMDSPRPSTSTLEWSIEDESVDEGDIEFNHDDSMEPTTLASEISSKRM